MMKKKGILMGLYADILDIPADKMGAIQSLRKGGDGNQGIRSLLSHAVWDNRDIVQSKIFPSTVRNHPHGLAMPPSVLSARFSPICTNFGILFC